MLINFFNDSNISEAKILTKLVWGDFFEKGNLDVQKLIYDFTFEYYDLNREYSFSITDNKLVAFLLAYKKEDKNNTLLEYKNKIKYLNNSYKKTALEVFNFVEFCSNETKNLMSENDIILGLFVSTQKGCGKKLLEQLQEICFKNSIKNIYLWSDSTCDYQYYLQHDFELVKEFQCRINKKQINTLIFKKEICK